MNNNNRIRLNNQQPSIYFTRPRIDFSLTGEDLPELAKVIWCHSHLKSNLPKDLDMTANRFFCVFDLA